MTESFDLTYRFRGRLESNAADPQEAWACLRCGALVQTQDRSAHRGWHSEAVTEMGERAGYLKALIDAVQKAEEKAVDTPATVEIPRGLWNALVRRAYEAELS